jgi:hypothetical protein
VKQILLTYLPSIIAAFAAVISAIAIVAAFVGIRDSQRHAERMQGRQFEEDDRLRKRDTLLKTGEELYQLIRKHTKRAPGDLQEYRPQVGEWAPEARPAMFLAEEKRKEDISTAWDRMETLVRLYHPDLLPIYSELLAGRRSLDPLDNPWWEHSHEMTSEDKSKYRRQFHEAKLGLLHILEQRLRTL